MRFILGIAAGMVLVVVLVGAYLISGYAPTAATDKPMPFETWLAGTALGKRMQKEAPTRDLSTMTTADLLAGADIYKKHCADCHGLVDQSAEIGEGMFPQAPQLMRPPAPRPGSTAPSGASAPRAPNPVQQGMVAGRGASGDFWRVKNGIRLTGMPSFEKTLSDDQMWRVVALIAKRRNLPPEVKAALQPEQAPAAAPQQR
jgi:mono/diheme cytochrome c family protein